MNTCIYPQCTQYIENKDKQLCASHNKLSRKPVKQLFGKTELLKPKKPKALAKHSDNVHYEDSNGIRYSSKEIEKNIHDAKAEKLAQMMLVHDYWFCEECMTTQNYLDNAHIISVDNCKKKGMVEYAWDVNNIRLLCRSCHAHFDRLDLQWTVNK